jgi:hypothetical protein
MIKSLVETARPFTVALNYQRGIAPLLPAAWQRWSPQLAALAALLKTARGKGALDRATTETGFTISYGHEFSHAGQIICL